MRSLLTLVACAAVLAAGCGDDSTTSTSQGGDGDELVTYARSGGFASYPVRLTVAADGAARVAIEVPDAGSRTFELTDDELARLSDGLQTAAFADLPDPGPAVCADCFEYEVTYAGQTYSYDDATEGVPSSVSDVVAELDRIANSNAPADTLGG